MTIITQVRDYYETYWSAEGFRPHSGVHPTFPRLVQPHIHGRCLDFGCGDGRSKGRWLSDRSESYVGVDVSQQAVDAARKLGLQAERVDKDLPFEDETFDVAVAFDVLEHLVEPHLACTEVLRVLRPGGVLIATVPNAAYWRRRTDLLLGRWNPTGDGQAVEKPWRDPHVRFFTRSPLIRMLSQIGFETVTVCGYGGAFVRDVPVLRGFSDRPSTPYRRAECALPSLLAHTLIGKGRKPDSQTPVAVS